MTFINRPSPNFNDRKDGEKPSLIILHFTGMASTEDALQRLTDPDFATPVSSHYLLDEAGKIYKLVDEDKRAWHAGVSCWKGRNTDLNSASIGIEISNRHGQPYPPAQIDAVIALCKDIMTRHGIPPENVIGHSDIAPGRKVDPGPHFPWKKLAESGIGHWPAPKLRDAFNAAAALKKPAQLKKMFEKAGYKPHAFGPGKPGMAEVIDAFQQHYRPELFKPVGGTPGGHGHIKITGPKMDFKTALRLSAIANDNYKKPAAPRRKKPRGPKAS